jgi:hypothetical protein
VVEGNRELIRAILADRDVKHALREKVQDVADKSFELDGEVKLIKGVLVTLVGNGDGSSGMVPRLERDLKSMGEDMSNLSSDVRALTLTMTTMAEDVRKLATQGEQSSGFIAGWTGAKTVLTIIGALITILAFLIGRGFHL